MIYLKDTVVHQLHVPVEDAVAEAEVVPVEDVDWFSQWRPLPVSVTQ